MLVVGALILAINFVAVPDSAAAVAGLVVVGLAALAAFVIRQRRTTTPLYDLDVAGRRIFWVAACAGIIVFGSLMGAMFIGQQFLQNVLQYSTVDAGLAILPAAVFMVLIAPHLRSSSRRRGPGSRCSSDTRSCFSGSSRCWRSGATASATGRSDSATHSSVPVSASRGRPHPTR
ncbi:MAG: hypothetical protein M5U19_07535 [Microthrixaceae bacterium]|nr:hypothetical protein [Microthrixaceae bacterium]